MVLHTVNLANFNATKGQDDASSSGSDLEAVQQMDPTSTHGPNGVSPSGPNPEAIQPSILSPMEAPNDASPPDSDPQAIPLRTFSATVGVIGHGTGQENHQ